MTRERRGDWMQTFTGRMFWPLDPHPDEVAIEDIAHSLSMQCRFAGHCQKFYSVAEHSILVSQVIQPEFAIYGLLHDAPEAYLVDVPRPVKPHLAGYAHIEARVWEEICYKFDLWPDAKKRDAIHTADMAVLLAEQRVLMPNPPQPWETIGEPADVEIRGLSPAEARQAFLDRFHALMQARP